MMKEKASIEASLHVLKQEKEATAASKEASIYEEAVAARGEEEHSLGEFKDLALEDPMERTRDYIETQPFDTNASQVFPDDMPLQPIPHHDTVINRPTRHKAQDSTHGSLKEEHKVIAGKGYSPPLAPKVFLPKQKSSPFIPDAQRKPTAATPLASHPAQGNNYSPSTPQTPDLAHYLMRREMVSSGLLAFDDSPENYWAWKASFLAATRELNLSYQEELNLLVKWLGPESSAQAKRIRSVHVNDPRAGVFMVWERLEEAYGSPEVIESALLKKLDAFPPISNKDTHMLREFGDLLRELEAAKADGFLPGLMFLDTARGVIPIAEKLPFSLRERWIMQGSKYKEDYRVPFPPFSFFVNFVCSQAKTRNDPSFAFTLSSTPSQLKVEKTPNYMRKSAVTVRKTDVTATVGALQNSSAVKKNEPEKQCPMHNKPHPLSKCRGFRGKHLDERKTFLKENSICFRCCASTKHMAKDCKTSLKCIECESDKHISAMHLVQRHGRLVGQPNNNLRSSKAGRVKIFLHL